MTRIFTTVIAFLLLFPAVSFAQWEWLNPKPTGYICSKVIFTDSLRGFILQSNGSLSVTVDQGERWETRGQFANTSTLDIRDSTGVIAGYGGTVYISRDNGGSWEKKNTGILDHLSMADIVSRDTLFLANENGKIYRSDDRGASWKALSCGIRISSIEFINSKVGFAGGVSTHILKTEDGGATWLPVVTVNTIPSNTTAIKFVDVNTGVAFRQHSTLLRTTDGGKTWSTHSLHDYMNDIYSVDRNTGFAVGQDGAAYRTDDGGVTWKWVGMTARIAAYGLNSVYFLNANTGFAVGLRGRILKTKDGGTTWTTYSATYIDISDISAPTLLTAYATAGNHIFKTTDGGNRWQQLELQVGTEYAEHDVFEACHFFNADTGFVTASDHARIYKTYDGGLNWKMINPSRYGYETVTDLQFLDGHTGFLAADIYYGSTIVKTKDAGETWAPVWSSQYQGETFNKIFFHDEKNGYATRYGNLYKTTDSARTWTKLWEGDWISAVCFVNAATGFVAGENGMLKQTTDSGNTWHNIRITPQYYDDIYSLKFLNEQVGYLTAEGGAIYKTVDSGKTWRENGKSNYSSMRAIHVARDTSVYIAGEYGAILRTSDASEFRIDSLTASSPNCNTRFTAIITAALKPVDSIHIEYGIGKFDHAVRASPSSVPGGQQRVTATVDSLAHGAPYNMRVKLFFKGQYQYSQPHIFVAQTRPPKPVITATGVILYSSVQQGNQWYVNDTAITGATGSSLIAGVAGKYTVRATANNCPGPMSDPFNSVITNISSPVLENQLRIGPNPVHGLLHVRYSGNPATLLFTITDIQGRELYQTNFSGTLSVDMNRFVSGVYVVQVRNTGTKERVFKTIIKN